MCNSNVIAAVGRASLVPATGQTYRNFIVPTAWNRLRLPGADARAHRASYEVDSGSIRVVPSVIYLPDSGARVPGVVSLAFERAAPGDPLRAKAEYGWSGKPGGSFEVVYRVPQREASLKGEERPSFASTTAGRAPGSTIDGAWLERLGPRSVATLALSADRLDLRGHEAETALGRLELRHRATDEWTVHVQVSGAIYDAVASGDSAASGVLELRRGTLSVGTSYEARGVGLKAVYRNEENSAAEAGGHGGRVALQGTSGGWRASLYVDAQQRVANLELDVQGGADLPPSLTDLGMVAARPEDVMGVLREHYALLAQHGVTVGPLRLHALRMQGGLDFAWRESSARRLELGIQVALDEVESDGGERRALLGRLYTSWRAFGATDLTASYENWFKRDLVPHDSDSVIRFGVRTAL